MNCLNCAAPLAWHAGRQLWNCLHCGSQHRPPKETRLSDRLEWRHQTGTHQCPACEQPLETAALDDFPAQSCRSCEGVLLADEVFGQVVRNRRAAYRGGDRLPTPIDPELFQRTMECPGCHGRMEVHPYYGPGSQVIDSCRACGLIWLDSGELVAIEQAPGRR
jgi:Zn-finger nucleic acid-binding protein